MAGPGAKGRRDGHQLSIVHLLSTSLRTPQAWVPALCGQVLNTSAQKDQGESEREREEEGWEEEEEEGEEEEGKSRDKQRERERRQRGREEEGWVHDRCC